MIGAAQVPLNQIPSLALGQSPEIPATDVKSDGPNWVEGRELDSPQSVAADLSSGALYVADTGNNRVPTESGAAVRAPPTAGTGACSNTTCTFVPDIPYDETPARRGDTLGSTGHAVFSCGTNNGGKELGNLEYCRRMIRECGLKEDDFFKPRPAGKRAIDRWKRR